MTGQSGPRDLLDRTLEVREKFALLIGSAEAGLRTEENPERKLELLEQWKQWKARYEQADAAARGILKRHIDAVSEHLGSHIEQAQSVTVTRTSEDGDVTVTVDGCGQLSDLWLQPGILDRKAAAEIATEITRLVTNAGQQIAEQMSALLQAAAHDLPEFDTVIAEQENNAGAGPETGPQPR